MLGKLLKHEFRDTFLPMVIIAAVLLVFPIFGCVLALFADFHSDTGVVMTIFTVLNLFIQIFLMSGAIVVAHVLLAVRFYSHVYGPQGYLTLMLPVKRTAILNSKLIVSMVWILLLSLLGYGGCAATMLSFAGIEIEAGVTILEAAEVFSELVDLSFIGSAVIWIITYLVSTVYMIISMYCSVSIGQLFRKNRILASILIFIGIYSVHYILSMIISLITSITSVVVSANSFYVSSEYMANQNSNISTIIIAVLTVAFAVVQYIITKRILERKVNLQ